jgi:cobalt-zinc-cadmium efflux system outer membrane protein
VTIIMLGVGPAFAQSPRALHAQPSVRISLEQAEKMAIEHNRNLRAERTLILQSKANQTTARLRPNPVFDTDALFLPVFSPSQFTSNNLNNNIEFDAGVSYPFELGGKREARMKAAQEATNVTTYQVRNYERRLRYRVAGQFINVLYAQSKLSFAKQDLASFENSLSISEKQYKAGSISHGSLLKIQLQRLLFQTDVQSAEVEAIQAKNQLRQLVGFSALPQDFEVIGQLQASDPKRSLLGLEAEALRVRPDLQAARDRVIEAKGQLRLAKANGYPNLGTTLDYTHLYGLNNLSAYATIAIPIFNRNQGNIARNSARITQAQNARHAVESMVLTQVRSAYAQEQSALQVIKLYRSGYLHDAKQSLQISAYAYLRGDTGLINFLDAERSYRKVELSYRQALAKAMLTEHRLKEVVGVQKLSGGNSQP